MNNWLRIKKNKSELDALTAYRIIVHNSLIFYHCHCISSSFSVQRISDLLSMYLTLKVNQWLQEKIIYIMYVMIHKKTQSSIVQLIIVACRYDILIASWIRVFCFR
jgi:hypothetical protein